MGTRLQRGLRAFVALSLVLGGIVLLLEARLIRETPPGWGWMFLAWAIWAGALGLVLGFGSRAGWPWTVLAVAFLGSMLAAVGWSHFDETGHYVLGLLAPTIAILAGFGLSRSQRWAWPVAFAIAAGVGPLFLSFAPLPDPAYLGAMALFVADALALLALAEETFRNPGRPA